jgi:hypothetical protein
MCTHGLGENWMKQVFVITLVLALASAVFPVTAQDDQQDCDLAAMQEWLLQRQAWHNASSDVIDSVGTLKALDYLYQHLEAINDLPRPDCQAADQIMLWTYYGYGAISHAAICLMLFDTACVEATATRGKT